MIEIVKDYFRARNRALVFVVPVAIVLFTCGCALQRVVKDSSFRLDNVEQKAHHLIQELIQNDTVFVELPKQLLQTSSFADSSLLCTDYACSEARILGSGELFHQIQNIVQDLPIQVQWKDRLVYKDSIIYKQHESSLSEQVPIRQTLGIMAYLPWVLLLLLFSVLLKK